MREKRRNESSMQICSNWKKAGVLFGLMTLLTLGLTACKGGSADQAAGGQETAYMGMITEVGKDTITVSVMGGGQFFGGMQGGQMPGGFGGGQMPEGFGGGQLPEGFEPGQLPEGFGGGQMPEGFEGGQLPEGYEPGQLPEGFGSGQLPEGFGGGQMPGRERPEGQKPEGFDSSQLPEGFTGGQMPGGFGGQMFGGGETMTLKVTKSTDITVNNEKAKIKDLQVGDMIQFLMNGDKVTAITVGMSMQGFRGFQG